MKHFTITRHFVSAERYQVYAKTQALAIEQVKSGSGEQRLLSTRAIPYDSRPQNEFKVEDHNERKAQDA